VTVVKLSGLREVEKELEKLGAREGTRVLRGALFRSAKPIEDEARRRAAALPRGSGALEKSIGKRFHAGTKADRLGGIFSVIIAPIRNSRVAIALYNLYYKRRRPARGIFHGHLVEFGTKYAKAQPIFRPALESSAGLRSMAMFAGEMKKGIANLLKRQARAAKRTGE
jgi:HK97 gp10 family phage protein